ncbi:MAG: molybdopterin molybdotransferase MoeA [Bacteroidales bacterium]|nr:molybdopterin molybdotransferase MoeA [Bacteroidales bacterium]
MISFEDALETVLRDVRKTDTERVDFNDALYRVLAEDVYSDVDMPPFDKAAVDGYACRMEDLDKDLEVLEVIAAGEIPSKTILPGQCSKIMTGAMIPEGADTMLMVEHTKEVKPGVIRFTGNKTARNIAYKAEDVKKGDLVWGKGMQILPQHVAIFASVGCVNPLVAKQPRVAILSTGDELVEPAQLPGPGKIRNSNGFQLIAQVKAAHCIPNYMGIIPDDEEATDRAIGKALAENDMVILTGGVSMGDFDFVPQIMRKNKVEILFQKVAVKPGRPTVFGRTESSCIFGLPGNPVSSFINFEVFAKPLLYRMMGYEWTPRVLALPLGIDFQRKKSDRLEFLPVTIGESGLVVPVSYHGSAHIHAVCLADGIMSIPKGINDIKKGAPVHVRPI